ncbi:MAG: ATP-binding protein [Bacteroidales bacterium]|nr:ATP-binding protein [Bacteroidales bacterium]
MEKRDVQGLITSYHNRLSQVDSRFYRYLYSQIDWEDKLIEIKGAKGVGKTTLMLQHILAAFANPDETLYASLDDLWFTTHDLKELIDWFYTHGGRYLFLDEVHHYSNWQTLLKNVNDEYRDLHVVFSGSSMLQLEAGKGDLSRRLIDYRLAGLSFREFLSYEGIADLPVLKWEDLLRNHVSIAMNIKRQIASIQPLFEQYLKTGYYPFYKEVRQGYYLRLQNVVNTVLEVDYPQIDDVSVSTIEKTKKMLMVLAESVPQVPTMSSLYGQLDTDRNQGLKMMYALQRADLLILLTDNTKSLKTLSRPEKIFLNNSNLMYALGGKTEIGTIRETFFINQIKQVLPVSYPAKGDLLVDKQYLFEVGGASKTFDQIKDESNSFLAVDNTEIGSGNRIPLWMFGLLY